MATKSAKRATVMVVDDEPDAAQMTACVLRLAGYDVLVAFDGREALAAVAANCPRIIIMDIDMPGVDGYEAARSIRSDASVRTPPMLVALTARSTPQAVERSLAAGFDAHLAKPLFGDALVDAIDALSIAHGDAAPPREPS